MAKTYADLQRQIETLQQRAEEARRKEIAGVVKRMQVAIRAYGLTPEDLGFATGSPRAQQISTGQKSTRPAFSDGQGNTWSGRGPRPAWLKPLLASGKTLEEL